MFVILRKSGLDYENDSFADDVYVLLIFVLCSTFNFCY